MASYVLVLMYTTEVVEQVLTVQSASGPLVLRFNECRMTPPACRYMFYASVSAGAVRQILR